MNDTGAQCPQAGLPGPRAAGPAPPPARTRSSDAESATHRTAHASSSSFQGRSRTRPPRRTRHTSRRRRDRRTGACPTLERLGQSSLHRNHLCSLEAGCWSRQGTELAALSETVKQPSHRAEHTLQPARNPPGAPPASVAPLPWLHGEVARSPGIRLDHVPTGGPCPGGSARGLRKAPWGDRTAAPVWGITIPSGADTR